MIRRLCIWPTRLCEVSWKKSSAIQYKLGLPSFFFWIPKNCYCNQRTLSLGLPIMVCPKS